MSDEKHEFQKAVEHGIKTVVHFTRGFAITTFGTLWNALLTLATDVKNAKDWYQKAGVLCAILIIGWITYNAASDVYWWGYKIVNRSWYEQQFLSSSEREVAEFFKLYTKKFIERDCSFMRKVGIDEAMYDKFGTTEYGERDYSCNNYYNGIVAKYMLPFEVQGEITSNDKKRIRGKMIVVRHTEDGKYSAGLQVFELWKVNDWDLWRFNASSMQGSTRLPLGLTQQE